MPNVFAPSKTLELEHLSGDCRPDDSVAPLVGFGLAPLVQVREEEVFLFLAFRHRDLVTEVDFGLEIMFKEIVHQQTHAWTFDDNVRPSNLSLGFWAHVKGCSRWDVIGNEKRLHITEIERVDHDLLRLLVEHH